jgi:hypothetical protein
VQLTGSPEKLAYPAVCARCGSPAGRRIRVEKVFSRSDGDLRTAYAVLRTDVPFCLSCTSKHRSEATGQPFGERVVSLFRSVLLVPALGFAVAALWSLLQAIDRLGGGESALRFAGLFAGFALLTLVCTRAALRRTHRYRVAEPSSVTSAFDFTDDLSEMFERERHDYRLANPVFGDAFVAVNASRVWHSDSGRARAGDRGRSAVLLLSLTGGVAVLGWLGLSVLRG